jgi:hypothetical protein
MVAGLSKAAGTVEEERRSMPRERKNEKEEL